MKRNWVAFVLLPDGVGCAGCCRWNHSRDGTCLCLWFLFVLRYFCCLWWRPSLAPSPSRLSWIQMTGWSQDSSHTWHRTNRKEDQCYYHISRDHDKCVTTFLQWFYVSKCLRVFGNPISQDVLHTCSYFLQWGKTCHKKTKPVRIWSHLKENLIHTSLFMAYRQHQVWPISLNRVFVEFPSAQKQPRQARVLWLCEL